MKLFHSALLVATAIMLFTVDGRAPLVTGVWESLSEVDFNERNHFQGTTTLLNPFTKVDTGLTARQTIANQAASFGWPLAGLYISGSGSSPHLAIHRSQFPTQTGSPAQRAERLQTALQTAMDGIYKSSVVITDPLDPDFGQTVDIRNFWVSVHVWNYRTDGLYVPRIKGVGDYAFRVSDQSPPGNWWQERQ
jgi:hypothetical protein